MSEERGAIDGALGFCHVGDDHVERSGGDPIDRGGRSVSEVHVPLVLVWAKPLLEIGEDRRIAVDEEDANHGISRNGEVWPEVRGTGTSTPYIGG